jgi:ABC-2 type transport system permease protein
MIFWFAALQGKSTIGGWDLNSFITYYLLLIVVGSLVVSHVEDPVDRDIRQGDVAKYFVKPFPYYLFMLFMELPYRLLQGFYGVVMFTFIVFIFPAFRIPLPDIQTSIVLVVIIICAFLMTHTYKMLIGLITFWTKDVRGFTETSDVLILLLAGYNLPLALLPDVMAQIAYALPFAYFMYFPVIALQGKLSFPELLNVLLIQLVWLSVFAFAYRIMLKNGLKKFTAVGQ